MLHLSLEPCHQSVRLVTSGDPRLANCDLAICRHPGSGLSLQERLPFRQRGLESRCEDGGSSAQTSPAVQFQSQHLTMFGYCYYLQSTSRPRQSSQWQLIAAAVHFLGFIVCLSSLSPRPHYPGSAAAVLNSNHAVKDEPEPVLAVAAAARCWESGECAADGGGDTRNSSAGNYDLHTDAGTTTTTTTSLTLAPHCTCTHCPARHCPVVLEKFPSEGS